MTETASQEKRAQGINARIRKMQEIRRRCRELLKDGSSATEHGDFLYDENGLPK